MKNELTTYERLTSTHVLTQRSSRIHLAVDRSRQANTSHLNQIQVVARPLARIPCSISTHHARRHSAHRNKLICTLLAPSLSSTLCTLKRLHLDVVLLGKHRVGPTRPRLYASPSGGPRNQNAVALLPNRSCTVVRLLIQPRSSFSCSILS